MLFGKHPTLISENHLTSYPYLSFFLLPPRVIAFLALTQLKDPSSDPENNSVFKVLRLRLLRVPLDSGAPWDLQEPFHSCLSPLSFYSDLANLQRGKKSEPSI